MKNKRQDVEAENLKRDLDEPASPTVRVSRLFLCNNVFLNEVSSLDLDFKTCRTIYLFANASAAERVLQRPTQGEGGYKDNKGAHPRQ